MIFVGLILTVAGFSGALIGWNIACGLGWADYSACNQPPPPEPFW